MRVWVSSEREVGHMQRAYVEAPFLLSLHRLYREPPFKYGEDDFDSPPRDAKPRHKFVRTDSGRLFLEEET